MCTALKVLFNLFFGFDKGPVEEFRDDSYYDDSWFKPPPK